MARERAHLRQRAGHSRARGHLAQQPKDRSDGNARRTAVFRPIRFQRRSVAGTPPAPRALIRLPEIQSRSALSQSSPPKIPEHWLRAFGCSSRAPISCSNAARPWCGGPPHVHAHAKPRARRMRCGCAKRARFELLGFDSGCVARTGRANQFPSPGPRRLHRLRVRLRVAPQVAHEVAARPGIGGPFRITIC